ncbi:MAG: TatD family hydrolase [Verrucomicrobiota bacterium]
MIWFDCHNHLQFSRLGDPAPLLAAMHSAGVERCVVNATCEAEWAAVAALVQTYPESLLPAFGIHPNHAHQACGPWHERLAGLLDEFPQAGVGECGLDRRAEAPSMDVQMPLFLTQLQLARDRCRTLTIHCVKAWGLLIDALAADPPPPRFVLHGFAGSVETARRLLPMGAYFSFCGEFLQTRRAAVLDVFRQLPPERILLETDAPDRLPPPPWVSHPLPLSCNHPANLPAIGSGLAAALGMQVADIANLTTHNARVCFARSS